MAPIVLLPPFSRALTQAAVEAATESYPKTYIIGILLPLSSYLITLIDHTNILGEQGKDPYCPSLRTLHDRLQNGLLGPSALPPEFLTDEHIWGRIDQRTEVPAMQRPLADFEDLYYALVARMQDMHHLISVRASNGFNDVSVPVFTGGPTITDLHSSLSQHWNILNDPAYGKALDDAIRRATVDACEHEIRRQVQYNKLEQQCAQEMLADLWDPKTYTGVKGLSWIVEWTPALVAIMLEQRYRVILVLEKDEAERKAVQLKKHNRIRAPKKVTFSREPTELMDLRQHDQGMYMDTQKVDKNGRIEVKHHVEQQQDAQYRADRHDLEQTHHQESGQDCIQQDITQERARQEQIHGEIEAQMREQRVSEYTNYLRARASQSAHFMVQNIARSNNAMEILTRSDTDAVQGDKDMGCCTNF
ncbi:hypothetical protein BKA66DRAFT_404562 [Pyrenochaeta sp. MPI-SDFR-AT-0127]|nr:hypothetical protein BKA66DRAFT_404562 [Pyrenochaeta sp. MPI-SDFR-AT-0127]